MTARKTHAVGKRESILVAPCGVPATHFTTVPENITCLRCRRCLALPPLPERTGSGDWFA